jgi:hypothetical protein
LLPTLYCDLFCPEKENRRVKEEAKLLDAFELLDRRGQSSILEVLQGHLIKYKVVLPHPPLLFPHTSCT